MANDRREAKSMFGRIRLTAPLLLVSTATSGRKGTARLRLGVAGGQGVLVVSALGMFAIAWGVQTAALRINANVATGLFLLYSALMGALLSGIFIVYKMQTIGAAFLITGGTFGAMSVD